MNDKNGRSDPNSAGEYRQKKPEYEKPRLIKLEEEMNWSVGGPCPSYVA